MKTETAPTETDKAAGGELDHIYCCDENLAICGCDITDHPEITPEEVRDRCVVCKYMEESICERCGE